MGLVTLDVIVEGLDAIIRELYNTKFELGRLLVQAKSEYLIRDKFDLYLMDMFEEDELVVMREWKNWGPWGIPLEEVLLLLQKEDPLLSRSQLVKASKKKWKEEYFPKLPSEIKDAFWHKKGTAGVDLAVFQKSNGHNDTQMNHQLTAVIEFKCEVLHQLNPSLLDPNKMRYIHKDIDRLQVFQRHTKCDYFEILVFVDFLKDVPTHFHKFNNHYEPNAKLRSNKRFSPEIMHKKLIETYGSDGVHEVNYIAPTQSCGGYLGGQIQLHFWIISQKQSK